MKLLSKKTKQFKIVKITFVVTKIFRKVDNFEIFYLTCSSWSDGWTCWLRRGGQSCFRSRKYYLEAAEIDSASKYYEQHKAELHLEISEFLAEFEIKLAGKIKNID